MNFFFNGLIALGVLIGILLVVTFSYFTNLLGPDLRPSSEFMSTLLGAAIALAGTVLTIYASVEATEKERDEKDQALVSEIFVKFQSMVNNLYHFREHLREAYKNVDEDSKDNPALFVLALASHPEPIHFSAEEKALFLRRKKTKLANDVGEWDGIHNSLVSSLEKYAELRQVFVSVVPADVSGSIGTSCLEYSEYQKIAPLLAQMNYLIEGIRGRVEADYGPCVDATKRMRDAMEEICHISMDLKFPD